VQVSPDLSRDGYVGPVRVLTSEECKRVVAYLRRTDLPEPPVWEKARAVRERLLFDLATRPAILDPVRASLGPDVVLWGVSAVWRAPGQAHPWHSDIESCGPEGGFVSVWIGLENTSRHSSLQLISGSHRFGRSVQEARAARGIARDDALPDVLLELAREHAEGAALVAPDMGDGEAVFFDGRIWHGTANTQRTGDRVALLLQFAAADRPVRVPDWDALDWPFRIRPEPLPPVILVSGSDRAGANQVVPPPSAASSTATIGSVVHRFELPLADAPPESWRPFPAFRGATPILEDMSCHASVLDGGHSPHPPHAHLEEELLLALHGDVELVVATREDDPAPEVTRIAPGSFVYYPSGQYHTIRNPGASPVAYLMLKWRAPTRGDGLALDTRIVRFDRVPDSPEPFSASLLLDGPTGCLRRLHSHLTVLRPDAGYEPHRDAHDVAIVLLEGSVETLGQRVEPLSIVYSSAGELHGMRNVGTTPARYVVFEFHAPGAQPFGRAPSRLRRLASRLRRARARRP
jgi:mannose-6-phosphate isomerase-like protein (cupin superfamily)